MRRRLSTVRVRTTVVATAVVTVALVIGAVVLVGAQYRTLLQGLEQRARSRVYDVSTLAKHDTLPERLTAAREGDAFTQVVDSDGQVVAASKNLRDEGPVLVDERSPSHLVVVSRTVEPFDETFRVAVRSVMTPTGRVTVYAGDSVENIQAATRRLALLLALGIPFLAGLVGFITWKVVGRALRPVEAIRSEVGAIREGELHRRVPEPDTDDEVGRLARTMNAMLARLDDAAERQQVFVSDASHELQSPLTSLRARLEVNLAAPSEPDWRAGETEALGEVVDMQRLVDDLLTLARLESHLVDPVRVPVDLDDVVLAEAARLTERERVVVDVHGVSAGQVVGDPDQLRRAFRNLLDNAERHAATCVTVAVREGGGTTEVEVRDDGPGVPAGQRHRVFERFARVDDARSREGGGTGLGLAITREIVEAHDGAIRVDDAGPGALFVVTFPTP